MKLFDGGFVLFLILNLFAYSAAKHEKERVEAHCKKHPHGEKCKK